MAIQRAQLPAVPQIRLSSGGISNRGPSLSEKVLSELALGLISNTVNQTFTKDRTNEAVDEGLLPEDERRDGFFKHFRAPLTQRQLGQLQSQRGIAEADSRRQGVSDQLNELKLLQAQDTRNDVVAGRERFAADEEIRLEEEALANRPFGEKVQSSLNSALETFTPVGDFLGVNQQLVPQVFEALRNSPIGNTLLGGGDPTQEEALLELGAGQQDPRTDALLDYLQSIPTALPNDPNRPKFLTPFE